MGVGRVGPLDYYIISVLVCLIVLMLDAFFKIFIFNYIQVQLYFVAFYARMLSV